MNYKYIFVLVGLLFSSVHLIGQVEEVDMRSLWANPTDLNF
mgnify:CR=1 FL=1